MWFRVNKVKQTNKHEKRSKLGSGKSKKQLYIYSKPKLDYDKLAIDINPDIAPVTAKYASNDFLTTRNSKGANTPSEQFISSNISIKPSTNKASESKLGQLPSK